MTGQQAIKLIDQILEREKHRKLNDLESKIILQTWEGITYQTISNQLSYELDYIKQVAARLWKLLSHTLGEKIVKSNVKSVLERSQELVPITNESELFLISKAYAHNISYGFAQKADLQPQSAWMISDRCQVITFFDSGETTKSHPAIQLTHQVQIAIEDLLWQNLHRPFPPNVLMNEILSVLTVGNTAKTPINCLVINYYC